MRHLPPVRARVLVEPGAAPLLDRAAAAERPERRFLSASWFAAAGARTTLALVEGDAVRAAIPLGRRRGIAEVPGSYWPFRSVPFAADLAPGELAGLLSDPLARRALGPAWRLGPIEADDPVLLLLQQAAPTAGWTLVERHVARAFVLDLRAAQAEDGGWPRGSTLRKNRQHERAIEAAHGVLSWRLLRGPDWTPALFDALAAIERRSWVGTRTDGTDAKFAAPRHRAFWEALARDPAQAGRMNVALLTIAGELAAFSFDLDCGPVRYAIANSYDPAFARHSPGKCLAYRNLVDGLARGIERVDWGAGDSGYKTTMGALAGPALVDCLFLRGSLGRLAARVGVAEAWRRSGRTE